jgi:DNA (cytosine-5)-methyltransferase 1
MVKAVQKLEPKIFIAENVKGLMTWENGLALQTITSDFKDAGYTVDFRLMNAADFGVPQSRRRVIIVGVKDTLGVEMKWPDPTHCDPASAASSSLQPWVDLEQAIGDLEDEHKHSQLPNSGYSKAKLLAGRQGNTVTKANRPAPTMRAEHHGHIEFHYRLDRRLSAREAARIQSFPDKFEFLNSTTDAYRQIGNAVAPVFGWHLGVALREILDAEQ